MLLSTCRILMGLLLGRCILIDHYFVVMDPDRLDVVMAFLPHAACYSSIFLHLLASLEDTPVVLRSAVSAAFVKRST